MDVSATSKGKGYAGVIKRWNFHRLKETHGSGPVARHGGSNGANSSPSRVFPGLKMAGHLGAEKVTVQNLDSREGGRENNLIALKGAVPRPERRHCRDPRQRQGVREGGIVMPTVAVLDMNGKEVEKIDLSEAIFGIEPNKSGYAPYGQELSSQPAPGHTVRADPRRGFRRRQKAVESEGNRPRRQGSTRAPQWTHGGIVFAPKPRDYSYAVNKKVRRLAMKSAFSSKVQDNEIVVLDSIALDEYKTKTMAAMLKAVGSEKKALIVLPEKNDKIVASAAQHSGR